MGVEIGPLHMRRSILILAPPARVWEEFQSLERIRVWLGRGHEVHRLEPRLGGLVDLSVEIDGIRRHFGGAVRVFEDERELTCDINWAPPLQWPEPTFWTFRLSSQHGGTLVEILHHGFERLGEAAADQLEGFEAGWDIKHLKALRRIVEGGADGA